MDGVSGDGPWRAVNMGCIGDGHQLAIANQLVGCNSRNGGRLAFTKCCSARKRLAGGLEDVRIEKMQGVLEPFWQTMCRNRTPPFFRWPTPPGIRDELRKAIFLQARRHDGGSRFFFEPSGAVHLRTTL